jgi:CheY-like chemotaxis protein/anti-sigma regulatory factor (Ser/Thr protein kinase)
MSSVPHHLLLVEDSPTQLVQMRCLLEEAGYQVSVATNGRDGLAIARSEKPKLVVTDLNMPEINGLELVAVLKDEAPELPVVLTTAQGSEDVAAEALRRGAASYVPKKNVGLDLVITVRRLLAMATTGRSDPELLRLMVGSTVAYRLGNDDALVPRVIVQLKELLRQMEICDERALVQVSTALDEALVNAIVHGNLEVSSELREVDNGREYRRLTLERRQQLPYSQRTVFVSAELTRTQVEFVIRDEGPGFNPNLIPDPTDPAFLERPSGRGLLLINAFMDHVSHNEQGNEIRMIKRKAEAEASLPI